MSLDNLKKKVLNNETSKVYHDLTKINYSHDPEKSKKAKELILYTFNQLGMQNEDVVNCLKNTLIEVIYNLNYQAIEDMENQNRNKFEEDMK